MDTGDLISLSSSIVILISVIVASVALYFSIRFNKVNVFEKLVKNEQNLKKTLFDYGERIEKISSSSKIRKLRAEADTLLFNFYEYIAIIYIQKNTDLKAFNMYFCPLLPDVHEKFLDSIIFDSVDDRVQLYPNLCKLFNKHGLSILK